MVLYLEDDMFIYRLIVRMIVELRMVVEGKLSGGKLGGRKIRWGNFLDGSQK